MFGYGLVRIAAGENVPAPAAYGAQFVQNLDGLPGEWHDVLGFHLHARRRDDPHGAVQVDFTPLGTNQLVGADEGQCQQAKGMAGQLVAHIAVPINGPQQRQQLNGSHGDLMLARLVRGKRLAQIGARIAFAPSGGDAVAEHLP